MRRNYGVSHRVHRKTFATIPTTRGGPYGKQFARAPPPYAFRFELDTDIYTIRKQLHWRIKLSSDNETA
eukprot:1610268-Pyramimonas_sp.AAC.1